MKDERRPVIIGKQISSGTVDNCDKTNSSKQQTLDYLRDKTNSLKRKSLDY